LRREQNARTFRRLGGQPVARVFLSYDRDDASKARAIANALEKGGHTVWWDFRIQGGAEYTKEIEQALADADAVVVLWSKFSVESAWVRDEAAAGRDKGRLVPARLDEATPPLGFRQYQNIDLRSWKGRGRPPVQDILSAIAAFPGDPSDRPDDRSSAISAQAPKGRRLPLLPILTMVIVAVAAFAVLLWQPWRSTRLVPLVAVVPALPDKATKSLAADLLVKLGVLQSSHADALQLVEPDSRQTPDFIIKVGSSSAGKTAQASIMLVDNRADTLLWTREFTEADGKQADLRQQMAYSAAQVLDCAVQAGSAKGEPIKLPTLKLYLSGCADMSNLLAQDPRVVISIFRKVTEQAPKFEGGWKKLLLSEIQALRFGFGLDPQLRRDLKDHMVQAQRLDPAMAEAIMAEAWAGTSPLPIADFIKLIDKAIARDPDNPHILAYQAIALTNVGRMQEALASTRRAGESNPLSPSARDVLIVALLNNDQVAAARNEVEKSEQLWPGATNVLQSRFAVEFRAGDPAIALQMMKSGELGAAFVTNAAHESYLQAKIEPTAANKELAVDNAHALYLRDPTSSWVYARALSEFDRHEQLIEFLLKSDPRVPYTTTWVIFRPSFFALHRDRRFMVIAHRFGLSDFWRDTGKWPDFCARPDLPYDCKAEVDKLS
jgi:tetratricopeptide (TPR) repeat protein